MQRSEQAQGPSLAAALQGIADLDAVHEALWQSLRQETQRLCDAALKTEDRGARRDFHWTLHLLLGTHAAMPHTWGAIHSASTRCFALRKAMFGTFLAHELDRLSDLSLPPVPDNPGRLVEYLLEANAEHTASRHPIFDYLREEGSLRDVKSFFYQESSVDSRFDDLIALAQVGLSGTIKDEYAHNFADEMGHGNPERVHTVMFERTADYISSFRGFDHHVQTKPCTEALACSNMQIGMALDRRQVWRLAGYLAAFELNATDRCRRLVDACVRHGMDEAELGYLTEHVDADVGHAQGLFQEIIEPLAAADERAPVEIAQGFLLRLQTSADYCDVLLRQFLLGGQSSS